MDSVDNQEIKPFHRDPNNNIKKSSKSEVAKVTVCLIDHKECIGIYTDSGSDKYLVSCKCPCHKGITHLKR